ncbi:MAG: hypothetical protein NUV75_05595 [Gallionella sp.]|nr:hypothetical protein [Gallionella sp.]
MLIETKNDIDKLGLCFSLMDTVCLFRNEQVNDHSKRVILRLFFIQIDNILKLIGKAKNKLFKKALISKEQKEELERLTRTLEISYTNAYDTIHCMPRSPERMVVVYDVIYA